MKVLVVLALAVFTGEKFRENNYMKMYRGLNNLQNLLKIPCDQTEMFHQQVARPTYSLLMSPSHSWSS